MKISNIVKIRKDEQKEPEKRILEKKPIKVVEDYQQDIVGSSGSLDKYINFENLNKSEEIYNEAINIIKNYIKNISEYKINGNITDILKKIIKEVIVNNHEIMLLTIKSTSDDYIYAHTVNTTILAAYITFSIGYSEDEIFSICLTAFLHDIGMISVKNIYNKPVKLSEVEFIEIKKHPFLTKKIIESAGINIESVLASVLHIHERVNRRGYPAKLSGEEIHEFAKVLSVIDVYEAMTHHRIYRKKIDPHLVLRNLIENYSDSFEQHLIKKLIERLSLYPLGSFVVLNTEEIGRVIRVNSGFPTRPVVNIILDTAKNIQKEPKIVNLAESPLINIKESVNWAKLNVPDRKLAFKLSLQDWWIT